MISPIASAFGCFCWLDFRRHVRLQFFPAFVYIWFKNIYVKFIVINNPTKQTRMVVVEVTLTRF